MNFKLGSNPRNRGPPVHTNQCNSSSRPNPFLNSGNNSSGNNSGNNSSGNNSGNSNNMFYNNSHQAVVADETAKAEATAESKEEFPSLVLAASRRVRHCDCSPAAATAAAAAISYKASLVSGINTRMLEEQSKMRSAQAAELERKMEVFNEERISSARAERAVLANRDVVTDLDVLYID